MMNSVPLLGRLRWIDYQRILLTLLILFTESLLRFFAHFLPIQWISNRLFPQRPTKQEPLAELNDAADIIKANGYGVEEHTVITSDGYLLVLHRILPRIPHSGTPESDSTATIKSALKLLYRQESLELNATDSNSTTPPRTPSKSVGWEGRPPILAMHGLLMTSEIWVICRNPNRSIAFALCDAGYDVWLANRRGNKYSHKHLHLKSSMDAYWDFSIDQTALLDIPALIDYILQETGYCNLTFLGFSQGNAEGMGALSLNRSLNDKINLMICLSPMTKPHILPNSLVQSLIHASPELLYLLFGKRIFLSITNFWRMVLSKEAYVKLLDYCMHWLFNWTCSKINARDKPTLYSHLYSYTSTKMIVHWFQIMKSGRFQMYDDAMAFFGPSHIPPSMPIAQISVPIAVFVGEKDTLCDADYMLERCKSVVEVFNIPDYEHLDFIWSEDLNEQIIPRLFELLARLKPKPKGFSQSRHGSRSQSSQRAASLLRF